MSSSGKPVQDKVVLVSLGAALLSGVSSIAQGNKIETAIGDAARGGVIIGAGMVVKTVLDEVLPKSARKKSGN